MISADEWQDDLIMNAVVSVGFFSIRTVQDAARHERAATCGGTFFT